MASPLHAAEIAGSKSQAGQLEEIMVTARKRVESLETAPISISAFTAADLSSRSLSDISGIARSTPNLTFVASSDGAGSSNVAQVAIRGIGQFDFLPTADPGVGIYLDGVYLGRTTGGVLTLADIQQVEVLRGPQGTLFGRNTIGGAINITTKKPTFETEGFVQGTAGTDNLYQVDAAVGGPIAADKVAARVAVQYRKRDGFQRSINYPHKFGNEDKLTLRGQVLVKASESFNMLLTGDYYHADQESQASALLGIIPSGFPAPGTAPTIVDLFNFSTTAYGGPLNSPPIGANDVVDRNHPFTVTKTGPSQDKAKIWGTSATLNFSFDENTQAKSVTAYRQLDVSFADDADTAGPDAVTSDDHHHQWQFSQEFQLTGNTDHLNWLLGLYYYHENAWNFNTIYLLQSAFMAGSPFGPPISQQQYNRVKTDSYAGFGHLSYKITNHVNLVIGARYTHEKKDFDTYLLNINVQALGVPNLGPFGLYFVPPTALSQSFNNFAPHIGLNFTTDNGVMLYGSYSKGFKSGSFNGRPQSPLELGTVKPEKVDAFEAGAKGEFFERRLRMNLAAFYNLYKNIQLITVENGPTGFIQHLLNAAEAKIKGVEFEATARPTNNLMFQGNLSYMDAKITQADPAAVVAGIQTGNRLRKAPRWNMALAGEYTYPLSFGEISARLDWSYRSSQYHQATNNPLTYEGGYGLLDGRLAYKSEGNRWELAAYGKNLTNKVYYNGIFIPGGAEVVGYPARKREFGGNVKINF